MGESVRIVRSVLEEISAQAAQTPEMECCGLLGGRDGVITRIYPAENALASPKAYEIAPRDLFRILRQMREEGVRMMGIYHSHPRGENYPSETDITRAYYPEAVYFIASPGPASSRGANTTRAFQICDRGVVELELTVCG
jgi:proteasome lid subunit RPN8/RPN11